MFKSIVVSIALLMLIGCNSRKKDFVAGCKFGVAQGLSIIGLPAAPAQFEEPCAEVSADYLSGKMDKYLAPEEPEASPSPEASPEAAPEGK